MATKTDTQQIDLTKKSGKAPLGGKETGQVRLSIRLQLASFVSGAAVMVLEMIGSRLIAPFLGTSLIVWTSLIGVIMVSLCIGNWMGGHLADHSPEARVLARILIAAACIVALTAYGGNFVLTALTALRQNLYLSSLLAALIIFTPSSILLGMVSPFITRLALQNVNSSGTTVGHLSALNSLGSILGTFLGGFVLISLFPSGIIIMGVAVVLALLAFLIYTKAWQGVLLALCIGGGAYAASRYGFPMTPVGVQIDTAYNHISIVESNLRDGRRVRIMMTDPEGAQSLMYMDNPNELVSDYTKFYDLAFHFKPDTKRILMLGGGGYCVPRHVLSEHNVSFDVVEIDPDITKAAQTYFNLTDEFTKSPNLRIFHEDARTFINRGTRDELGPYDAIFMDVFGSWYSIPFQMTTVESAKRIRDLLTPNGILIMNVIASVEGSRSGAFHGIYSAFSTAFPQLMIFPASASDSRYAFSLQNLMLLAFAQKPEEMSNIPAVPPENIVRLLNHRWQEPFTPMVPAFTDAFAPVERYALMSNS